MTGTMYAPTGRVGPLEDVEVHVGLAYYDEDTDTTSRWDVAVWDGASAAWVGDPTLHDVSCQVLSVNIARGRDLPLERFRPGTCTVTIDDPNGTLSPWRTLADPTAYATIRPGIGLEVWALVDAERIDRFVGFVDSIEDTFPLDSGRHAVRFVAFDYMAVLGAYDGLEQSPAGADELGAARLGRILTNADYTYPTSFDEGTVELQATTLAKNALDECGMVTDTETGALFCEPDGTLVFRDRNGLGTDTRYVDVQAVFGELEPEICYSDLTLTTDLKETRNTVTIAPDGGSAVTHVDEESVALFGPRTYRRLDLIHSDPAESGNIADRYLAFYAFATNRIDTFTVLVTQAAAADPANVATLLALGLLHRVEVRRRADGFQVVAELQIEAVEEIITPDDWSLRFRTFSADSVLEVGRWDVAEWDTGEWGY